MKKQFFLILLVLVYSNFSYSQQWSTVTNNNIWNLNPGNVGIGINNPEAKLDVNGDIMFSGKIGKDLTNTFNYQNKVLGRFSIGWYSDDNWNYHGLSLFTHSFGGMKFFTRDIVRLAIEPFGNVGIGIELPTAKFHNNSGINNYAAILATSEHGNNLVVSSSSPANEGANVFKISHEYWNNDRNNGYISFHRGNSSNDGFLEFGTSGLERLRINSIGNVGIGTSTPSAGLEIYKGNSNNFALMLTSSGLGWGSGIIFRNTIGFDYGIYSGSDKKLHIGNHNTGIDHIVIHENGNVGINTRNPQNTLDVNGTIHAKEVIVDNLNWSDFVFDKDYNLRTIQEVDNYIKFHKHLPDIPSAQEVKEKGVNVSEMQSKLLQKIEELTLYVIQQDKKIKQLEQQVEKDK